MNDDLKINDPRTDADFDPALLPLCDGGDWPSPNDKDRMIRRMWEFAWCYYHMNKANQHALRARQSNDSAAERAALQRFENLSDLRDRLEDKYAPEGFLAEPRMDQAHYADLRFQWSGKNPAPEIYRKRFEAVFDL